MEMFLEISPLLVGVVPKKAREPKQATGTKSLGKWRKGPEKQGVFQGKELTCGFFVDIASSSKNAEIVMIPMNQAAKNDADYFGSGDDVHILAVLDIRFRICCLRIIVIHPQKS